MRNNFTGITIGEGNMISIKNVPDYLFKNGAIYSNRISLQKWNRTRVILAI